MLLLNSQWASVSYPARDGDTFMAFARGARPAYDSNGARIIFFHPEKAYQYAYMLETDTWHKIASGIDGATVLN